jgi:oxygen-independent coproporphyrinogen-3 oxidase
VNELQSHLIAKYDVASPRYTSYPTVPYWSAPPDAAQWLQQLHGALQRNAAAQTGLGLYVHLPFCHSLCTYCGCNTRITRTHAIVGPYIEAVLAEYRMYRERLGVARPLVGELHLGGGTPTFLDCAELEQLLGGLLESSTVAADAELSVEVDPRVTSGEQLALLAQHGFRRISLGVQDFDPRVQRAVNRTQGEEQVSVVSARARGLGFESVNFDLIYGLPLQTLASIEQTMDAVCRLRPDRIALYGYAHVPWMRPGQRGFDEGDLPTGAARRALYEQSRERLESEGYREIGLDHFALESDSLWLTAAAGRMHRNFMGYTSVHTEPLLGLGVSAIGDAGDAFAQNEKDFSAYQQRVERGELPIQRGHLLDDEDRVLRRHILNLMTRLSADWSAPADFTASLQEISARLVEFERDGLLQVTGDACRVTASGRAFLRNICMAFDARMARQQPDRPLFSRGA